MGHDAGRLERLHLAGGEEALRTRHREARHVDGQSAYQLQGAPDRTPVARDRGGAGHPDLRDNHGCPGIESGRVVTLLDAYVSQVATHGVPHRLDRLVTALRYVLPENALIRTPSLNRASLEEVR